MRSSFTAGTNTRTVVSPKTKANKEEGVAKRLNEGDQGPMPLSLWIQLSSCPR